MPRASLAQLDADRDAAVRLAARKAKLLPGEGQVLTRNLEDILSGRPPRAEEALWMHKLQRANMVEPRFGQHDMDYADRVAETQRIRNAQLEYARLKAGIDRMPAGALRQRAYQELRPRYEAITEYLEQAARRFKESSLPTGPMPGDVERAAKRRAIS